MKKTRTNTTHLAERAGATEFMVVTTEDLNGRKYEVLGPVWASCASSRSVITDLIAHLRMFTTGGELKGYSKLMDETTSSVVERITEKARSLQADAVVSFRLSTCDISEGASELVGIGTAVRFTDRPDRPRKP